MSLLSDFSEDFSEGIFGTEDGMAVFVSYTPIGGAASTIPAIINYGDDLEDAKWRAALQASATAWVKESDVSEPSNGDTLAVDGENWTVMTRRKQMTDCWKLELRRDLRPTFRK